MNIDEAIGTLKKMLKLEKECLHYDVSQSEIQAIETLINEYNNLKDLNEELQIRYTIENMKYKDLKQIEEAHRIENGKLREKLKQELEKRRKLTQCHLRYEEMTGIDLLLEE